MLCARKHNTRRVINSIAQQLIAASRACSASMVKDQPTTSRTGMAPTPQQRSPTSTRPGTDAPPSYATLHKHLKAKSGTVYASYLYEAYAAFLESGTTLLPAASPLSPEGSAPSAAGSTARLASTTSLNPPSNEAPCTTQDGLQERHQEAAAPRVKHATVQPCVVANNVVAAPATILATSLHYGGHSNPHPYGSAIPTDYRDGDGDDLRPVLLFDLNGTITSHTVKRRSSGINKPRPGIPHLRRLLPHFRLGVFTSSTWRTVQDAVSMLEKAAGPGPPLFSEPRLILHRANSMQVPANHIARGGKSWDTVKPLHPFFQRLHRVLLLDDDEFKALDAQRHNMVLVPVWQQHEDDPVVQILVDVLLDKVLRLGPEGDVRKVSKAVQNALWKASGRTAADVAQQKVTSEDVTVAQDVVLV